MSLLFLLAIGAAVVAIVWQLLRATRPSCAIPLGTPLRRTEVSTQIQVAQDVALITMPIYYELVDMIEIIAFLRGEKIHGTPIEYVHFVVYDCSQWEGFNVLGMELMELHWDPARPGATLFCGLHGHMARNLEEYLLENLENLSERHTPLFFGSVEEGMAYIKQHPVANPSFQ